MSGAVYIAQFGEPDRMLVVLIVYPEFSSQTGNEKMYVSIVHMCLIKTVANELEDQTEETHGTDQQCACIAGVNIHDVAKIWKFSILLKY